MSEQNEPTQEHAPATSPAHENAKVVCQCTSSVPQLLHRMGVSLLISTYQTGHVIVARAESEAKLNTLFRRLPSPMGIALSRKHLAIGTKNDIWEYRNNPAVSQRLDPPGKSDVVFLPTSHKITGDIRIHEMVYIDDELWFANTRFSCLATWSHDYSFVPRWRPPFISELAAEDRCHLNGIAVRDNKIAFVSALGTTDTPQGWRENKTSGGVIMEIPSGKIIVDGLSMPHSPRWHNDQLWILESGKGSIARIGADNKPETVAQLPGFTRGLAFAGPLAFVGLSKVRETNIFGGIQLNDRVEEKRCGIAVVDTRSGKTVGMMRFDSGVEEIFDVQLIRGKWPEMMDVNSPLLGSSFFVPDAALKDMKQTVDKPPEKFVQMDKEAMEKRKAEIEAKRGKEKPVKS